jgi:2-C-methyl-D-erythritol 2,4-cyclodiphosphate synthase
MLPVCLPNKAGQLKMWIVRSTLEHPKVNPHIPEMKSVLAPLMNIEEEDISIKATTAERLGYVGREEGVNAYAVALDQKRINQF